MNRFFKLLFRFILPGLMLSSTATAAPIPATSSSEFLKADLGLFRSTHGFKISAEKTAWVHTSPPQNNKFIATIYKAPYLSRGVQPSLTVRTDKLKQPTSLKKYMKSWLNDYPRLGFKVLTSKKVKVNGEIAFLVDAINRLNSKQLRQVIFLKKKTAVVLTCRDHKEKFHQTVKDCNQIIKNFAWM